MGLTIENLSMEDLCDLMCGRPEDEIFDEDSEITEESS